MSSLYNRYIPKGTHYVRVQEEDAPSGHAHREEENIRRPKPGQETNDKRRANPSGGTQSAPLFHLEALLGGGGHEGKKNAGIFASILKALKLDDLDTGDVLLMLIVLFLFLEGDNLELVIALGLMLLMGIGGENEQTDQDED